MFIRMLEDIFQLHFNFSFVLYFNYFKKLKSVYGSIKSITRHFGMLMAILNK